MDLWSVEMGKATRGLNWKENFCFEDWSFEELSSAVVCVKSFRLGKCLSG